MKRGGTYVSTQDMKRGQVAIFIIIAIVIVFAIGLYFAIDADLFEESMPKNFEPVYEHYKSCIKAEAENGIRILGEQGGRIYVDEMEFVPGSRYMPFSSQLDFFGQAVPYWFYISGNNLLKEQVPSESDMEQELERYIQERTDECDFSQFNDVNVNIGEFSNVNAEINENNIEIEFRNMISMSSDDESVNVNEHDIKIDSKLGRFHSLALETYNYEKQNMFLEDYAIDVMRMYAPVTDVELGCAPKVFNKQEIKQELVNALEANIQAIKLKGDYYELKNKDSNYFVTDIGEELKTGENVNFIYNGDWPTRIEIYGDDVVEPVGMQEGLGILGFCYVAYHFVYDINFPVLIQFYSSDGELFQFPVSVIIDKNQKRDALEGEAGMSIESEVCKYKNQEVDVYTYDENLNPVEARIRFKCLNSVCEAGETSVENGEAHLETVMPQCVNGFILADADGYSRGKYQISTNNEQDANIILKKKHDISLDLGSIRGNAVVNFDSEDYGTTIIYPDMKSVELVEGYYNVSVYVYDNSTLTFPEVNERKCVDIPKEGIAGVVGMTQEECFDINLPETKIEAALIGGGKTSYYMTTSELQDSKELNINVPLFSTPGSLDELQDNYARLEEELIYLDLE